MRYPHSCVLKIMKTVKLLLIAGICTLCACSKEPVSRTEFIFDTYCKITVPSTEKNAVDAVEKAFNRMREIENKFNIHKQGTPLYKFNRNETSITDPEIINNIKLSNEISRASNGAFDITLKPLMELWGFYNGSNAVPSQKNIEKCLERTGYKKIEIKNNTVSKKDMNIQIDLGGIIKGYAVDSAAEVLRNEGIKSALIDAGGDVYGFGEINKRPWGVGIKNPRGEKLIGVLEISGKAVVTSGDYERYFIKNNKRYHHILNPKTGYPAQGVQSVTIIGPDAAFADGLATAVFVMGPDKGLKAVDNLKDYEAVLVRKKDEILVSQGLENKITKVKK
ncbi:MAG: FAD:protein FMN transferase [Elusimicrobiota bacterium]